MHFALRSGADWFHYVPAHNFADIAMGIMTLLNVTAILLCHHPAGRL
jgi:Na+/alanine symporter